MAGVERAVVLVNDLTVQGRVRLQKYGFIAAHLYKEDLRHLGFYNDWKPHHYGPYSHDLAEDLRSCVSANVIDEVPQETPDGNTIYTYTLKPKGRKMLRDLAKKNSSIIRTLHEKFAGLNKKRLDVLLRDVYEAYPGYTINSKIKDEVVGKADADPDNYERFSPEIEAILDSIDDGTFVGKEYTVDEYIKYVKKVLE